MKKLKKLFTFIIMAFSLMGIFFGSVLSGQHSQPVPQTASADFSSYSEISNALPQYLSVDGKKGNEINEIFLQAAADSKIAVEIANDPNYSIEKQIGGETRINPAYFTDAEEVGLGEVPQEFYYFSFTNALSLYRNLSNTEIQRGMSGENILQGEPIANYASYGTAKDGNKGFSVEAGGYFTPQKLNLSLSLDTSKEANQFNANEVTLYQEGLYTLAIPVVVYYTSNGGSTFTSLEEQIIYYTFMIFNADTYFRNSGDQYVQNVTFDYAQLSNISSSDKYSQYHFFNYSSAQEGALPTLNYNHKLFKISIKYLDLAGQTQNIYLEYQNGELVFLNTSGQQLADTESLSFAACVTQADEDQGAKPNTRVVFKDLGEYEISFEYLYIVQHDQATTVTYNVPIAENETSEYKDKDQKVFIYGYQAMFADYATLNPDTNQTEDAELRTFELGPDQAGRYRKSADITSAVIAHREPGKNKAEIENQGDNYAQNELFDLAEKYINQVDENGNPVIEPVSTNQPPIKFVTNAKNLNAYSQIYKMEKVGKKYQAVASTEDNPNPTTFQGFNQNNEGTYLYIIQYTYDKYMGYSGGLQAGHVHYQMFFFTVTSTVPSVTVMAAKNYDESTGNFSGFETIYTRGFTNKTVFILNNAKNNDFDAEVKIKVTAYNYLNASYIHQSVPIEELVNTDSSLAYGAHTWDWDNNPDTGIATGKDKGKETKYGVQITNTHNHNAKWTITIESATTSTPSVQSFTIDTNPIEQVTAFNANKTDSSYYLRDVALQSAFTSRPIAMSWAEKKSLAPTYGYIKHIPFDSFSWVPEDENTLSSLLQQLVDDIDLLPTSSEIDLNGTFEWGAYANTLIYGNKVPSTLVKGENGIYILQVYDQAGNYTFEIFMVDQTSPIFVQVTESNATTYQLITNGTSLSVPQDEFDEVYIKWTSRKGIHMTTNTLTEEQYAGYQHSGIENTSFKEKFTKFIDDHSTFVQGLPSSCAGHYFVSNISDLTYIKEQGQSTYSPFTTSDHSYKVQFFQDATINGAIEKIAREGTCKIILQDESNGYSYGDPYIAYLNYPSAYLSFNVTSDLTKFTILDGGLPIEGEAAFHIVDLYKDKESGELTTKSEGNTETTYRKKFSYLPSLNTTNSLSITFHPAVDNGLKLGTVNVKYYPYERSEQIDDKDPDNYYHFFKTISNTASHDLTMFTWDDKAGYTSDSVVTLELALGQSTRPLAGKYVITRQYLQDDTLANKIAEAYDFFCRTMTFFVDSNGIISSLEEVNATNPKDGQVYTAFESLIGGEILINTHGGKDNSDIAISFPQMKDFGSGNYLNSGSFFSQSSFSDTTSIISISRDTNKLPIELYIPKYKYTIKNDKVYDEKGAFENKYTLTYNDLLSYYGSVEINNAGPNNWQIVLVNGDEKVVYESGLQSDKKAYETLAETLSITSYELNAEILFTPKNGSESKTFVSARTNGDRYHLETNPLTGNNYLQFYECNNHTQGAVSGANKNKPVADFFEVGTYTVTVYQSGNDPQSSIYGFYRFAFEITSAKPSFDVIDENNFILQSVATENIGGEEIEVYYTNSDTLTLRWEDPTDPYFAKVDQSMISIDGNTNHEYKKHIEVINNVYSMPVNPSEGCVKTYKQTGLTITFQYEGHDDEYYDKTIKKIYFDTQAPTDNLNALMEQTAVSTDNIFSSKFQMREMRVYTDYHGNTFNPTLKENEEKAAEEASYITNVNAGVFKNYAFVVNSSFFTNCQKEFFNEDSTNQKWIPKDGRNLSDIYFREIDSMTSYTQSNKNTLLNFSSFTQASKNILDDLTNFGQFYEIVEVDWAGNRTIYVIYLQQELDEDDKPYDGTAITYTDSKSKGVALEYVKDSEINNSANGFNLYANSGFSASDISYNQDPWMFFTASINGVKGTYFKSPDLSGRVYQIVNDGNNKFNYIQKEIAQITSVDQSSSNKHTIVFADRVSGVQRACYLTVMDANLIINKVTDGVNETIASISINVPTTAENASIQTGYIFPVKVEVSQYVGTEWRLFSSFSQAEYGNWVADNPNNVNNASLSFNYVTSAFTNQLIVSANAGETNQKMKFVVTDNFGGTATTIILTGNAIDEDWSTKGDRFYIVEEIDGLCYISSDEISYIYNANLYYINPKAQKIFANNLNDNYSSSYDRKTGLTTITFSPKTGATYYDGAFKIEVCDSSDTSSVIKVYYIRICNTLPQVDKKNNSADIGTIVFLDKKHENIGADNIKADTDPKPILMKLEMDGVEYVGNMTTVTTYSRNVTVSYRNGTLVYDNDEKNYQRTLTYSGYITADEGATWTRMDDVEAGQTYTNYIISGVGTYYIIIKYDDPTILTSTYKIFEVNILDSASSYYYITVFGQNVKKSEGIKYSEGNVEYEVTYIVSLEYADKYNGGLNIHENKELEVTVTKLKTLYLGQTIIGTINPDVPRGTIVTEIYYYECEEAKGEFVIIYIPSSDNIVGTLNYELPSKNVSLKDGSAQLVVPHRTDEADFDKLRVSFTSYYGVEQNQIKPVVYKLLDGQPVKLNCEVFQSSENISYISLETAGTYYLQVLDSCTPANSQVFTGKKIDGYDYVEITFLPSVPFDVITTNSEGERVVTAPVQKAIYNSEVTIQLTNISTYYSSSAELTINATRNGQEINVSPSNHSYTFTTPGYYTIEFSATASNGIPIRLEKHSFTIINKNESRYAFEFAEYSSYYIEKVIKDGIDVTQDLIDYANFKTIVIGNKRYLSSISLNYLDQKTGRGRYEIKVRINNPSYEAVMGESFEFQLWINTGKPPITVSIPEGGSTSDVITVTFNVETLYNTIGDCYITIGSMREDFTAENTAGQTGIKTLSISGEGTYYIQVYTQSGQLLYSYKVTKTQPLNSFAILAIVLGVVALAVVIFITIKLRKRQKVK